jgi:hypothetical protein
MQEGRNTGGQTDRGTERQMYKYTYRQIEIKTYRIHRQTFRQMDSTKDLVQAEKQTDDSPIRYIPSNQQYCT